MSSSSKPRHKDLSNDKGKKQLMEKEQEKQNENTSTVKRYRASPKPEVKSDHPTNDELPEGSSKNNKMQLITHKIDGEATKGSDPDPKAIEGVFETVPEGYSGHKESINDSNMATTQSTSIEYVDKAKNSEKANHLAGVPGIGDDGTSMQIGNSESLPYIVLVGDVGTGKSTIFEKVTGKTGHSSEAKFSHTTLSESLATFNNKLVVADTPGCNGLSENLLHDTWIAKAINCRHVSKIFIVVKAETRIDTVVSNAEKYADCFIELPMDVLAVLVTHMDIVSWTEKDLVPKLERELGIDNVVFSSIDTDREALVGNILKTCIAQHDLSIDSNHSVNFFKIHENHRKILKFISDEVKKLTAKKEALKEASKEFGGKEKIDLLLDFQAYMTEEIDKAKQRVSDVKNFTFADDIAAIKAGHIASMLNQLRPVLDDIRAEIYGCQISEMRKCPHCGKDLLLADAGFKGTTDAVFATFTFKWTDDGKIIITKSEGRNLNAQVGSAHPPIHISES